MDKVFEYSKRIHKIPKFVFYAMGYAFKRIFFKTSSGIMRYFMNKTKLFPQTPVKNGV